MTDHAEEQEMEAEALAAIFDTHFNSLPSSSSGDAPLRWQVEIYPEMTADADELDEVNHVAARLVVELPADYPERLPVLACELIKGLVEDHRVELLALAQEEAVANEGAPCIFAVVERLREWLADNNQKGLDDLSMHAQMIRKQQAKEKEVSVRRSACCVVIVVVALDGVLYLYISLWSTTQFPRVWAKFVTSCYKKAVRSRSDDRVWGHPPPPPRRVVGCAS
jgi:hypothetical protein